MKKFFLLFVLLVPVSLPAESFEPIYLSPGEIHSLNAPAGQSLKVSNGKVLQTADLGSKINLFALKEGEALVYIGSKTYPVFVLEQQELAFLKDLLAGIKLRMGIKAAVVDKKIQVTGNIYRWSDLKWIFELAQKHQSAFVLNAKIDRDVYSEASRYVQSFLNQQALGPVQIQWGPPSLATISASQKNQLKNYEVALAPFGLLVETRDQQLALLPSVQVEVVMAEITERVDREFGLEWSPFGEFQILPQASFKSSLGATLKALESRGLGKILATPRILCRSGSEAEFHSGGEFPIAITEYQSHYKSQNITWKKHGIVLKFKPQADRQGRMSIKIYAELSVLSEQQVNGTPAVLINKIESEFDLSKPQTVALSGLIRQDWHKGQNGLPWVSQIPILGSLFSSQKFLNRKSELVIFVTPKIIPETDTEVAMPEGWKRDTL